MMLHESIEGSSSTTNPEHLAEEALLVLHVLELCMYMYLYVITCNTTCTCKCKYALSVEVYLVEIISVNEG